MSILIAPYDPAWPVAFERLRAILWPVVAAHAMRIEHVGSTSVPGLSAKPIIDIDVVVRDPSGLAGCITALEPLGWVHRGTLGIPGRHAFGRHLDYFPHHLYVCLDGSDALTNHLLLRDYLRTHPSAVDAYGQLKRALAATFPDDIDAYVEGKTAFIVEILAAEGMSADARAGITRVNKREP